MSANAFHIYSSSLFHQPVATKKRRKETSLIIQCVIWPTDKSRQWISYLFAIANVSWWQVLLELWETHCCDTSSFCRTGYDAGQHCTAGNVPQWKSCSLGLSRQQRCWRAYVLLAIFFFFQCCPCLSTTGRRIATRIIALTTSMKKITTATISVNVGPVTPEILMYNCTRGDCTWALCCFLNVIR